MPDAADNSWMTHSSALTAVATSLALALLVFVILWLHPLLWPRSVAGATPPGTVCAIGHTIGQTSAYRVAVAPSAPRQSPTPQREGA